ncbi:MAG: hypothetical protein K2M06_04255 [Muribaculaceae bacterium]|nr:hypothetical protein [Muribaculaceae bacterium]
MLVFPSEASILFPQASYDYAVFKTVGDAWARGAVPYRDIFDNKGPLLYVIQIIGALFGHGKLGIWLLGVLAATVSFELMYRCGRMLEASSRGNAVALMFGICAYALYLDGGNTVEQWSLPAELLPLYMVLRHFRSGEDGRWWRVAFVTGFCFGCVAVLRINNNCIIAGIVMVVALYMWKYRMYTILLKSVVSFLCGLALAVLPFVLYFHAEGALDDMMYANYLFNLSYMKEWPDIVGGMTVGKYIMNIFNLLPCALAIYVSWIYGLEKGRRYFALVASPAALTFLVFLSGETYLHYFMMGVPMIVLVIQMSWCCSVRLYRWMIVVSSVVLLPSMFFVGHARLSEIRHKVQTANNCDELSWVKAITELIPEAERDYVYTYGAVGPSSALNRLGYTPAGKYFYLQMMHRQVDACADRDILVQFSHVKPRWILSAISPGMTSIPDYAEGYEEVVADSNSVSLPVGGKVYRRIENYKSR